jgi:hypothetical protein
VPPGAAAEVTAGRVGCPADRLFQKVLQVHQRTQAAQRAAKAVQLQATAAAAPAGVAAQSLKHLAPKAALLKQAAAMSSAILASKLDEVRDAFVSTVRTVKDLIKRTPPPPGGCDELVEVFKQTTTTLKDALNNWRKSNELSQLRYTNANKAWQKAVNAVLECLGIDPMF